MLEERAFKKFRPEGMKLQFHSRKLRGNIVFMIIQLRTLSHRETCPPIILNSEAHQIASDT